MGLWLETSSLELFLRIRITLVVSQNGGKYSCRDKWLQSYIWLQDTEIFDLEQGVKI